jgi:hypothetical protein
MKVKSDRLKKSILTGLADKEMVNILNCCMFQPKSIPDIRREKNISHTTPTEKLSPCLMKVY